MAGQDVDVHGLGGNRGVGVPHRGTEQGRGVAVHPLPHLLGEGVAVNVPLLGEKSRQVGKRGWSEHSVILSIAVVVSLIISIFLSNQAFVLTKYNVLCTQGNYKTAFGTLDNLLVLRNDYRDEELYTIEFTVNDVEFKNLVNSFSIEQCNQFTSFDGNVEVRYSYIKGEIVIYQIVTNTLD